MDGAITFDDALAKPADPAQTGAKPITFDDAIAAREAATHMAVDTRRLGNAQALRDQGLTDPRSLDNPDVPIENFMRKWAPEIQKATGSNFGTSLKADLVEDPQTKVRLVAQSLNLDPKRVGLVDGRPVYVNDQGALQFVSSGAANLGAKAVANLPEFVAGVVGSVSASPVAGGTLGAMGAKGIKRAVAGAVFDEPQTVGGNLTEIGIEGGVNAIAGGVGKGLGALAGRGKILDFSPANVKNAQQAREAILNSTGIDVDLAQASGNSKLIALRAYAARYPGKSAELVQAAESAQSGQLDTAVTKVLDQVAKATPSEIAGTKGINAASMVIQLAKGARDKAAAPFYEAAGKVTVPVDVVESLSADPLIKRAAQRVAKDPVYQRKLAGSQPDSVAYWQQVKRNLDSGYESAIGANNKTAAREYADAAKVVNEKLAAASPEYKAANEYWQKVTKETVEPLEESAVGVLARVENPKAATAAARIFTDPNITASEIRATRASIQQQDPEAWNGLVRQFISQSWNKAQKETQSGAMVNAAGKLRQALVGTPDQRAKMAAMMPTGSLQAFEDLMTAAQSLARTPTAGSNTMRDTEITGQLKGQGATILKWLTTPRKALIEAGEQRAIDSNVLQLTQAILDPAKQKQLRVVVKMSDGAKKAFALSGILTGQVAARVLLPGADKTPDSQQ